MVSKSYKSSGVGCRTLLHVPSRIIIYLNLHLQTHIYVESLIHVMLHRILLFNSQEESGQKFIISGEANLCRSC